MEPMEDIMMLKTILQMEIPFSGKEGINSSSSPTVKIPIEGEWGDTCLQKYNPDGENC